MSPGGTILVRSDDLDPRARRALIIRMKRIAHVRGLRLFVAGISADKARRLGADGVHLRHRSACQARKARRHRLATSAPVHNRAEAWAAARGGVDHVLISPLFATRSHAGATPMPLRCFINLAWLSRAAPLALGGMTVGRHRALRLRCMASGILPGWAAIDAWEGRTPAPLRQKRNCVPTYTA